MDINISMMHSDNQSTVDDDLLASPPLNKIAKSIFDNPSDKLDNIIRMTIAESDTNDFVTAQTTESILMTKLSNSPSNSSVTSNSNHTFVVGDIVWAQTDEHLPFWPAYILDPNNLPEELKKTYQHSSKKKTPVYFYGRNDYDIISHARMKDYQKHKDQMKAQHISGALYVAFRKGMRLADDDALREPHMRISWVLHNKSGVASSFRSSNNQINTKKVNNNIHLGSLNVHNGVHNFESGILSSTFGDDNTLTPMSETQYTPLDSAAANGTNPRHFTFPESCISESAQISIHTTEHLLAADDDTNKEKYFKDKVISKHSGLEEGEVVASEQLNCIIDNVSVDKGNTTTSAKINHVLTSIESDDEATKDILDNAAKLELFEDQIIASSAVASIHNMVLDSSTIKDMQLTNQLDEGVINIQSEASSINVGEEALALLEIDLNCIRSEEKAVEILTHPGRISETVDQEHLSLVELSPVYQEKEEKNSNFFDMSTCDIIKSDEYKAVEENLTSDHYSAVRETSTIDIIKHPFSIPPEMASSVVSTTDVNLTSNITTAPELFQTVTHFEEASFETIPQHSKLLAAADLFGDSSNKLDKELFATESTLQTLPTKSVKHSKLSAAADLFGGSTVTTTTTPTKSVKQTKLSSAADLFGSNDNAQGNDIFGSTTIVSNPIPLKSVTSFREAADLFGNSKNVLSSDPFEVFPAVRHSMEFQNPKLSSAADLFGDSISSKSKDPFGSAVNVTADKRVQNLPSFYSSTSVGLFENKNDVSSDHFNDNNKVPIETFQNSDFPSTSINLFTNNINREDCNDPFGLPSTMTTFHTKSNQNPNASSAADLFADNAIGKDNNSLEPIPNNINLANGVHTILPDDNEISRVSSVLVDDNINTQSNSLSEPQESAFTLSSTKAVQDSTAIDLYEGFTSVEDLNHLKNLPSNLDPKIKEFDDVGTIVSIADKVVVETNPNLREDGIASNSVNVDNEQIARNDSFPSNDLRTSKINESAKILDSQSSKIAPVFKGKAKIVSGASPFDSSPSVDSLFGEMKTHDVTTALRPASDNLFANSAAINSNQNYTSNVSENFLQQPSTVRSNSLVVGGANTPSDKSRSVSKRDKSMLSANDIFNGMAPVEVAHAVTYSLSDPSNPPAAPGVKVMPKTTINSIPLKTESIIETNKIQTLSVEVSNQNPLAKDRNLTQPSVPSVISHKQPTKPKSKGPPEGMIATPHGFIPIPTSSAKISDGNAPPSQPLPAPSLGTTAAKPIINHTVLTSLVNEPNVFNDAGSIANDAVVQPLIHSSEQSNLFIKNQRVENKNWIRNGEPQRSNMMKPLCTIVAFGFGGKLLTMKPKPEKVILHQLSEINNNRENLKPYRNGVIKVHHLIDVLRYYLEKAKNGLVVSGNLNEVTEFLKLSACFSGPLVADDILSTSSTDSILQNFIQEKIDQPISSIVSDKFDAAVCSSSSSSEKLLWSLLKFCLFRGVQLHTDIGTTDPNSPETKIIHLLIGREAEKNKNGQVSILSGSSTGSIESVTDMSLSDLLHNKFETPPTISTQKSHILEIEHLLVMGKREQALESAVNAKEWPLAMLISCVCGTDKYQEVVRKYASESFPVAAPLHLLSLIYSNQAAQSIADMKSPTTIQTTVEEKENLLSLWKHNLAAILSNKASDWKVIVRTLGYKLHSERQDIYAAHFAYLCSGSFPSYPLNKTFNNVTESSKISNLAGKYCLLGCDFSTLRYKCLADCISLSALRCTEILEYILLKQLRAANSGNNVHKSPSTDGIVAIGKSITGIFGWNNNSKTIETSSANTNKSTILDPNLKQKVYRVRAVLCPIKVRFAMVLADLGLLKEATAYALDAKSLVDEIGIAEEKKLKTSTSKAKNATNTVVLTGVAYEKDALVKPFSRKFVRDLDEFIDRLGVSDKIVANPSESSSKTSSGLWDLGSNLIKSINLKELVDGVPDNSSTISTNAVSSLASIPPPVVPISSASSLGSVEVAMQQNIKHQYTPYELTPVISNQPPTNVHQQIPVQEYSTGFNDNLLHKNSTDYNNKMSTSSKSNPVPSSLHPNPSSKSNPVPSSLHPNTSTQVAWSQNSQPPNPYNQSNKQQTLTSNSSFNQAAVTGRPNKNNEESETFGFYDIDLDGSNNPANSHNAQAINLSTKNNSHYSSGLSPVPLSTEMQHSKSFGSFEPPSSTISVMQQQSIEKPPNTSSSSKASTNPSATASSNTDGLSGGFMGWGRKSLLKFMYPDAHDATENLGKSVEAVYNKATGRWEFPDDANNDSSTNPANMPPPTMSMMSNTSSNSINSVFPPNNNSNTVSDHNNNNNSPAAPVMMNDPLASLMAPPSRRYPTNSSTSENNMDPLASLMAPPPSRYSMQGNNSVNSIANPPNSTMPGLNIWKPPPSVSSISQPFSMPINQISNTFSANEIISNVESMTESSLASQ